MGLLHSPLLSHAIFMPTFWPLLLWPVQGPPGLPPSSPTYLVQGLAGSLPATIYLISAWALACLVPLVSDNRQNSTKHELSK